MAETILSAGLESLMDFGIQDFLIPLLVFTILYALLQKTKILGDKSDLNAIIAIAVAIILSLVPNFTGFLMTYIPFVAGFTIILFGGILVFLIMGAGPKDILTFMKRTEVAVLLLTIIIVFTFYAVGVWFGSEISPYAGNSSSSAQDSILNEGISRLLNPSVMGTSIFLFLVALTVYVIGKGSKK